QSYFVSKTNANFPQNGKLFNLPTIQGVIVIADATNGKLLALTDSIEITILRTGAATAVAAKYLAKASSSTAAIIGCGNQGRVTIKMLSSIIPLQRISVYDNDRAVAERLAADLNSEMPSVEVAENVEQAVNEKDVVVTCTPSKKPVLQPEWISQGTFIAAVGSDNEDKQELETSFFRNSKIVTDLTVQAAKIGELHHAIEEGVIGVEHVYAELGEIICGKKNGRESNDEIIIFDSTGMALQDVATSVIVYEKARQEKNRRVIDFMD
ncbi:MAG: ornithine cyclodeaminase family protein, partial [Cyclobacteriaceae bacterium]